MLAADTRERTLTEIQGAETPLWKHIVGPAEPFLQRTAMALREQIFTFDPEIIPYAEYALSAQGKQLRPALLALSASATGRVQETHVQAAVIIELVHLATLVHDDIIDGARLRRGMPTASVRWGNEISVLLGDCLFAHALKLAAGFPTVDVCRAVAASTKTVCSGEILQSNQRYQFNLGRPDYLKVLAMKTGELFALACDLGAYLNHTSAETRLAFRQFGMSLGVAYQLYDDCLDLFGSEKATGKSLGTDLARGKITLPLLVAMERAEAPAREQLQDWVRNWHPENLGGVVELLGRLDALEISRQLIHHELKQAKAHLLSTSITAENLPLVRLADFLGYQTDGLGGGAL